MTIISQLKFLTSIASCSNESEVEHKIVIPLLTLLGYSNTDWKTQARLHKLTVDFLVHPSPFPFCQPYLVIEVKAPNQSLQRNGWQLKKYMRQFKSTLGLLTNGHQFLILFRHENHIAIVVEYSAESLTRNFRPFYSLLCKETAIKIGSAIQISQQRISLKFLERVSQSFTNPELLRLLNEYQKSIHPSAIIPQDASTQEEIPQKKKPMIITVFNNKGGVGKTTLTINLAATLTRLGKRVLLIDIDAQANLSTGLGIDPLNDVELTGKKDITHLLLEPRTKLHDVIYSKTWGDIQLDIIPSHIRLSNMESELIQTVDSDRLLAKKLKNHEYDFIFIDPPPSFGKVNSISLMASSAILIPTQLSPYPIRALEYVIDRVKRVEDYKEEALPILGIAVSMYDQRSSSFNHAMEQSLRDTLAKSAGDRTVHLFPEETWIPRLNIISRCPDQGYPIHQAEFDEKLSQTERESAQGAIARLEKLSAHLLGVI